jgi:uncharacterized protein
MPHAVRDRGVVQAESKELRDGDHPVLVGGDPSDQEIDVGGDFLRHSLSKSPTRSGRPYPVAFPVAPVVRSGRARPTVERVSAYVFLLEVRLHINNSGSLKSKRKVVHSIKAQVRQRFGASVAEIDGHDTWQRATLLCALVGGSDVRARASELERFIEARCPDGCSFERDLLTLADVRD